MLDLNCCVEYIVFNGHDMSGALCFTELLCRVHCV